MFKTRPRQPWICASCLLRQQRVRRSYITAAASVATKRTAGDSTLNAHHASPESSHDDRTLRKIFDSQAFWRDFARSSHSSPARYYTGLFQNQYLTSPSGFHQFAQNTLRKCRSIVATVLKASTEDEYRGLARELDRLSDLLCRVIDLSDFVRATHPDPAFQRAATKAYALMFEYMNVLNTTTGLNEQLQRASAIPEVIASWSEEEKTVAEILIKDFSKSAIDLPQDKRQKFVDMSNSISELGSKFVDQMEPADQYLAFDSSDLKGMNPVMLKQMRTSPYHLTGRTKVLFPVLSLAATAAIRHVENEDTRKAIYIASRTASLNQIKTLEEMLHLRAELANLTGYSSFSGMTLVDKMAKSPEAVKKFLEALSADNAGKMRQELGEMLDMKRKQGVGGITPDRINAWDKEYYRMLLAAQLKTKSRKPDFLPAYFSLGTVMQGLSRLFSRLYGVRFVPRESLPGETWNSDVRRLDVIDETEGHIAVVYCDLFARAGKNPNPAHFTLRCSRLISPAEVEEATKSAPSSTSLTPSQLANDGMATSLTSSGDLYQLPTIALICDFAPPSNASHPTLLTFRELQTLFHEMGHAIHSILGRTKLQNVSGTRCATDFAELPSVLMEHFAANPDVLRMFARHWETDAPLPYEMVAEKLSVDRKGQGAETETQILLAMLDQAYHSELPMREGFDSTEVFHRVHERYGSVEEPRETSWQGFFGHLVGYGGTYYSYLFDRAIAGRVWEKVFEGGRHGGAVSRDSGERYKREVLKWGGARDGWRCVAGVLGDEKLSDGGEEAMAEVGRWGVQD
ncbi:Mitochondrial intermediate peptidase [Lignoscripta atroalba]|nr:Mitochondrial intermediate peptidase [Lignoscripta atroalba]